MEFQNNELNINALPNFKAATLQPIQQKFNTVLIIEWLLLFAIIAPIALFILWWHFENLDTSIKIFISMGIVLSMILLRIKGYFSYKKTSYGFREHDIVYRTGWPIQKTTTVPFSRIQDSKVVIGFIAKKYGLAKLELNTASSLGDISLRGLTIEDAEKLNQIIVDKINNERNTNQ